MSRGLAPTRPSFRLSCAGTAPLRVPEAANDDEASGRPPQSDEEIKAALGHFARHHLNAAQDAHARATAALAVGDREDFAFWSNVCRALDRRLAGTLVDAREERADCVTD
ncbi:hypothetical protein [Citromicrobium bathyomarinum]|uniref:hypothetical protein n=1 Tax=Citromicrobium bathyomarinum TaxID=72174 RepID=UPI00315A75B4